MNLINFDFQTEKFGNLSPSFFLHLIHILFEKDYSQSLTVTALNFGINNQFVIHYIETNKAQVLYNIANIIRKSISIFSKILLIKTNERVIAQRQVCD